MIRALSYGGGVQSTAMLVLAGQGVIDYRLALFANVGHDSENPATVLYLEQYAKPYAESVGVELVELERVRRDGKTETIMGRIHNQNASIGIPVRMSNGAPANRNCTQDFKVKVVAKELKRRGATRDDPATVALGISMDEYQRMRSESGIPHERLAYPLIDLRMDRQDCINVIAKAGLPVPPKSSCYFCPFHNNATWRDMARNEPDLFARSVELERYINQRRDQLGKDHVWLSGALRPLDQAFSDDGQLSMFDDDGATCDVAGYCHI